MEERGTHYPWTVTALVWLDRFVHPRVVAEGGELLRRLRVTVAFLMVTAAFYPPWLVLEASGGHGLRAGLGSLSWAGSIVLLLVARRGGSPNVLGHGLGLSLMLPTFVGIVLADAPYTPHILALVACPPALTLLASGRVGWLWCGASMVGFGIVALSTDDPVSREWVVGLALTTVSIVAVGHAFEAVRRWAFEELTVARDAARAAADLKGRFLANMSHEIRTPMNGVLGMLTVLRDTSLDKDQRDCVATAHTSGVMLLELINDILDVSKIEAGQMVLEAKPFDLRALVEGLLDQIAVSAEGKGIELVARYVPGTPAEVVGDRGRVRQVLLNLMGNAIKYTDRGHVLITVERTEDDDGAALRCSVEDTGVGIPAALQAVVFEEFRQVDESTTRAHGGTGLGLAIVRDLVTLMGGTLGVRSEEGRGSTFWFTLPDDTKPKEAPSSVLEVPSGTRVLVVDDHPTSLRVSCEHMRAWGLDPMPVSSAEAALEQLRGAATSERPFSLALVDSRLPDMDGLELARAIEAEPLVHELGLILAGSALHRVPESALREVGCAAYLVKPMHCADLQQALVTAWQRRRANEAELSAARPRPLPTPEPSVELDLRVLVVDDNLINRKVAQRMLLNLGCRVDLAEDGREALAMIEQARYDVVFMDVQMPQMDGLEATQQLRRQQADASRVPVIAMTAHAMPEDEERCVAAGMDGYIKKPVTRRELLEVLGRYAEPSERDTTLASNKI